MTYLCVLGPVSSDTVAEEEEGDGLNCVDDAVSSERNGVTAGARELWRRRSKERQTERDSSGHYIFFTLHISLRYTI